MLGASIPGVGIIKLVQLFVEQAYDAWLRDPLDRSLFHKAGAEEANFVLDCMSGLVTIRATDIDDLDNAMRELRGIIGHFDDGDSVTYEGVPIGPMSYGEGTWVLHAKAFYEFDSASKKFLPYDFEKHNR
jgi:hypothetical protein